MGESSNLPARFYKVIFPSTITLQRLRIPNEFVERYGNELSSIVKLTDPIDSTWYVRLVNVGNTLWLRDGWEKFVEDHSIAYGYFLLFKYIGNSSFKVHIFDLTGTEVDYLDSNRSFEGTDHDTRNFSYKLDISSSRNKGWINAKNGGTHVVKRGRSDAAVTSKSQRSYRTRSKCKIEDGCLGIKNENLNIPRKISPKNPSFTLVLKPYHLLKYRLYVPIVVAEHLRESGYIELHDSNGKKWPVLFTRNIKHKDNVISSGWLTVVKEKRLKVGDTCVFELIDINKLMLKVFTFLQDEHKPNQADGTNSLGSVLKTTRAL